MKISNWPIIVILLIGSFSSFAFPTREVGNGGDAVVCRNDKGEIIKDKVWLLEYYNAKSRNEAIDLGTGTVKEKFKKAILRFAKFSDNLPAYLEKEAEVIFKGIALYESGKKSKYVFFTPNKLIDIPDSSHLVDPEKGCEVEQLAIRMSEEEAMEYPGHEYLIQKNIWENLDSTSRAGLILHEVLYKYAKLELKQENSIRTRYLNTILSASDVENMNFVEFSQVLTEAGYASVIKNDVNISIKGITRYGKNLYLSSGFTTIDGHNVLKIVFDEEGIMNKEETLKANPRTIYFASQLDSRGADVKVEVGGQKCFIASEDLEEVEREVGFGEIGYEEKGAKCEFKLPVGLHNFTVTFSKESGRSVVYFWVFRDTPISYSREMSHWFWYMGDEPENQLAGRHSLEKVRASEELVKTGSILVR